MSDRTRSRFPNKVPVPVASVPLNYLNFLTAFGIMNDKLQRHLARKRMGRASETRIIRSECHLNSIKHAIGYRLPLFNQALCRSLDRHGYGGIIIGCADNEVGFGDNAIFIGLIVMRQGPSGRLDYPHSFPYYACRRIKYMIR